MPVKLRLQRHGRKGYAYYHIVVADSRAPRDGKFIERLGSYNPNTHPATVDINFDKALAWLQKGAQPTDTVRNLLSSEGVLLKKHLLGGVAKGAFDEATAEKKFADWKQSRDAKLSQNKQQIAAAKSASAKARLEAEKAANKAKEEALLKKRAAAAEAAAEAAKAAAAEAVEAETSVEEATEQAENA